MFGQGYVPHNVIIDHTMTVRYSEPGFNQGAIESIIQTYLEQIPQNVPPVADAGPDQTVVEGDSVTLDGTGSYDPDGSIIEYIWDYPSGIILDDELSPTPSFTAPEVSADTSFIFVLYVIDDMESMSAPDETIVTVLNVSNEITHVTPLTDGWNIFSTYLIADNMDMLSIVQPLIDAGYLDKVLDEAGNAVLYFFGNWVNNIGDLANTEGYYIKVNDDVNLSIEGTAVELPYEIYLTEGWNIMGYPTDTAQDALTIVQPLIDADELDKVLDEAGNAILYFFGNWVNNIGDFEAGEGYYVKVSTTTSLTISAPALASSNEDEDAQSSRIRTRSLDNSHFTPIWSGNPFKRMAFWMIGENFADIDLEAGDEVAVFDGDLCVGTAGGTGEQSISNPLIIHAGMDDGCGNGFEEGDVITFRILDASESSEAVVTAVTYMDPGTGNEVDNPTFESLSDYAIILVTHSEFMEVQDELGLPETFALNQNYPNPFNPVTHIPFELVEPQHVKLVIYDITGKEVLSLVNDLLLTGRYTVQVNASDLATGIYFYRIYTDKFTATKKMILLK